MAEPGPILVIDDDDGTRHSIRELLEADGLVVVEARDGNDALGLMVGTTGIKPALVVLDLEMPRLPGASFLRVLRSYVGLRDIPVIVVSGHAPTALDATVAAYLQKPVDPPTLLSAVREHATRCSSSR